MPRNGSGGYLPPQNSWNPAINGQQALPNDWMAILNDITTALTQSLSADGQTPITGVLNFQNNRISNVGAPTGSGDVLRWEQLTKGPDIASAATITIPVEGMLFDVTGTTSISLINDRYPGRIAFLRFDDVVELVHSAALSLPTGVNAKTSTGDVLCVMNTDIGVWQVISWPRFAAANFPSDAEPTITWPYMSWSDTGNMLLKRRNAADTAWEIEGYLHKPALYGATFAELDALTEDQGPIICTDQDGILYEWDAGTSKYVAQTADDATALAKSSATNLITPAGLGFSLQPTLTGSATFAKATNQIQMTAIVPTLALEVGDVIQISGSTSNDNLYTVESITDADNLIVNYAHRNGAGSLSLTDETETVTVKRIAKWFCAPIGLGQAWVDVTNSRAYSTTYTSIPNRTMNFSITDRGSSPSAIAANSTITIAGVQFRQRWYSATNDYRHTNYYTCPPESEYLAVNVAASDMVEWKELR